MHTLIGHFKRQIKPVMTIFDGGDQVVVNSYTLTETTKYDYKATVSFNTIKDQPNLILIRSKNWKVEDEPAGYYDINHARAFYEQLLQAGFTLNK